MVSVIIVNHNYGKYIADAIESVLSQSTQDFELIIIDGNSTDDSRHVIYDYVNKYPQLITAVLKPTSGQAAALNIGFTLSKGDIIAFLDSDDYWHLQKLETIVKQHRCFNAVAHSFSINGNEVIYNNSEIEFMNQSGSYLMKFGVCMTFGAIASALSLKRGLCEKIFPLPENEYITYADSYIITSLTYYDKLTFIPDILTYQRIHGDNASILSRKKDNNFFTKLFNQTTMLINKKLIKDNLTPIPILTNALYKKFLNEVQFPVVQKGNYVIYGAGIGGRYIKQILTAYGADVIYFCDSDTTKIGNKIENIPIISATELNDKRGAFNKIFVMSQLYSHDICNLLRDFGFIEGKDFIDLRLKYYPLPLSNSNGSEIC